MVELKKLPLDAAHRGLGAKFAAFAGYDMPLQYEGLIAEHNWTRTHAGLFDVSHMGPCFFALPKGHGLTGDDAHKAVAAIIERLVPADIQGLKPGQMRYTTLMNDAGGVRDDLIVGRPALENQQGDLFIVVNAGTKEADFALIAATAGVEATLVRADDRALLALQGPAAEAAIGAVAPGAVSLSFMHFARFETEAFGRLTISRSGYTGEDGFEILVRAEAAPALAEALLALPTVKPIGLGARDSLRLEAGLCLYGHDLDDLTSPVEAGLAWTIQQRRRQAADFPGAVRVLTELARGPERKRVGLAPVERAPAREGCEIVSDGAIVGRVTSGGFSPTLNRPISMGYVDAALAAPGTFVDIIVRGQPRAAEVVALPFVPHRYKKG